jgi:protein Tex
MPCERALEAAPSMTELEDIYLPHRPKRRTRAMMAAEKGLEPWPTCSWSSALRILPWLHVPFVDAAKGVEDVDQALAGARDILAERMSEDPGPGPRCAAVHAKARLRSRPARGAAKVDPAVAAKFQGLE